MALYQGNDSEENETMHQNQPIHPNETLPKTAEKTESEETEKKEISNEAHIDYCNSVPRTPLAVPMVADTLQQSITRNDAKAITETRLKRLKELSQRPEENLSKQQKEEKRRIIRLEKNRRAAAMSRRKKKMYVKGLEEKCNLMQRHLAILEMENSHLRVLLNTSNLSNIPPNIPNMPPFQAPNMPNFLCMNENNSNSNTHTNTSTNTNTTLVNSLESNTNTNSENNSECEPVLKRRKLNDGSNTHSNTNSLSCTNSSEIPLPINNVSTPPPLPIAFMPIPPPNLLNLHNMPNIAIPQLIAYPPMIPPHMLYNSGKMNVHTRVGMDRKNSGSDIEQDCSMPPQIIVPKLTDDYGSMMEDSDVMDETVDGFGSVMEEMHQNSPVYL